VEPLLVCISTPLDESTIVVSLLSVKVNMPAYSPPVLTRVQRGKGVGVGEKTDKGALHNPIVRFHGPCLIIFLQRLNFLLPRDLKPNSSI